MGDGLLVPTSAVLQTGERDIAYRVESGDHFVPVAIKISPIQFGDCYQVLEGLKEGDPIVTSANFLVDSESRIRVGNGEMAGMDHGDHGKSGETPKTPVGEKGMDTPGTDPSERKR
jgi:Cu(I)/Ag(I) efflux system membrane fusion protein